MQDCTTTICFRFDAAESVPPRLRQTPYDAIAIIDRPRQQSICVSRKSIWHFAPAYWPVSRGSSHVAGRIDTA